MTSYLQSEAGDVLNSEAAERIVWDTFTGDAALAGAAAIVAAGGKIAAAQAALGGVGAVAAAAMRFASGAAAIVATGAITTDSRRVTWSGAIILASSAIVALARRPWEPAIPTVDVWDPPDEPESLWIEQPPG